MTTRRPWAQLPAEHRDGRVTFAALNRLAKASPRALRLWARVLDAIPGSRLMVLTASGAERDPAVLKLFSEHGIKGGRLVVSGGKRPADYLKLWTDVDLALDSFPYNGHTTSCDAAWMGVPTVTLRGKTHVARAGVSLLHAVGLSDLVAASDDAYVAIAKALASDLPKLSALRAELRGRVQRSVLRDESGLTRRIEAAYRDMWTAHFKDRRTLDVAERSAPG